MFMSHTRFAAWMTWVLAGLATLIWLPRLLGTEPVVEKTPRAVVIDITELPVDETAVEEPKPEAAEQAASGAEPKLPKSSPPIELDERRLLAPLEADLPDEESPELADQPGNESPAKESLPPDRKQPAKVESPRVPDVNALSLGATLSPSIIADDSDPSDIAPLKLKLNPTPNGETGEPQNSQPLPEFPKQRVLRPLQPPAEPQDDDYVPGASPNSSRHRPKVEPQTPLIPLPNQNGTQSLAGPMVKYWVVSSRCCSQSKHRCVPSCRFVCHGVSHDCQVHPVCFEELVGSLIPGAPVCIFAHGAFTRWQDVWQDAEQTYQWLRSPCPQMPLNFIYFTWPSEGICALASDNAFTSPVPGLDFFILGRRAERNGFYLADLIGALPPNSSVSLLGHSQGARTISSALHLLGGGTVQKQARWNPADCGNRIRVVFAAAAVDHDWLNQDERYCCALNRAECLLNLRNDRDLALAVYPFRHPFSARSLARAGFTRRDRRHLGEHECQVSELNVTPQIGHHHSWPEYLCRPEIAAAIAPYIYFESH